MELRIESLSMCYSDKVRALSGVNLTLTSGVYGLLGPNGAGKSTMIKILTGNLLPTEGHVLFNDKDIQHHVKEYCGHLGYVPQSQGVYDNFTARHFLCYMAALKGLQRKDASEQIEQLLVTMGLEKVSERRLKTFSGGMKQRVLIAQALLGSPDIIIMDEPTAGLDPMERINIRNFISSIAADKIILFATHVVSDVESIANKIILLNHGEILLYESVENLCERMNGMVFTCYADEHDLEIIKQKYLVSSLLEVGGSKIYLRLVMKKEGLMKKLQEDSLLESVCMEKPDLQDVYLSRIGESGRA